MNRPSGLTYKKRYTYDGKNHTEGYRDIDMETLKELYLERKWPIMDIADYFFVTHPTILNRLKEYNIPNRKEKATWKNAIK